MAPCKLVALDLDGTLTNSDKLLPEANRLALMQLQERGIRLALASGRPTYGIRHLVGELQMEQYHGYILAYNGGRIVECTTGEEIAARTLPRELLPALFEKSVELRAAIITYDDAHDTILAAPSGRGNKWIEHEAWLNNRMTLQFVDNFFDAAPEALPKCLMVGEPEHIASIEPSMREAFPQLDVYRSSPFFLEIVPKGIDKAASLETLCQSMGITCDNVVAMGDGYNDLSMVQYAGIGVAMANACDEVKAAADFISLSNDECGVAHAINALHIGM